MPLTWTQFADKYIQPRPPGDNTTHVAVEMKVTVMAGAPVGEPMTRQELWEHLLKDAANSLLMYATEHDEADNDDPEMGPPDINSITLAWEDD